MIIAYAQMDKEEYDQHANRWPDFKSSELACKETGELGVTYELMDALQKLRRKLKRPLTITSGYRSPQHSIEKRKKKPGKHAMGLAVDIAADSNLAYQILSNAARCGFYRIGSCQKGSVRFMHLDVFPEYGGQHWSY